MIAASIAITNTIITRREGKRHTACSELRQAGTRPASVVLGDGLLGLTVGGGDDEGDLLKGENVVKPVIVRLVRVCRCGLVRDEWGTAGGRVVRSLGEMRQMSV